MPSMAPSIQGRFIFQAQRLIHKRASRLSRPARMRSQRAKRPRPALWVTLALSGKARDSPERTLVARGAGEARRDLRLQTKDIAIVDGGFGKGLRVLNLTTGVLVMEFVAERSAIGSVGGQAKLLNEYGDNLVAGRIVGEFDGNALVL